MENFPRHVPSLTGDELQGRQEYLQSIKPFQLLPAAEIETIAANLTAAEYDQDQTLFVQDTTIITHIVLLRSGRLERLSEKNGSLELKGVLERGGLYGGLSLLFNNGVSTSTVRCAEPVRAYQLDRENFFRLCAKYPEFAKHFSRGLEYDVPPPAASAFGQEQLQLHGGELYVPVLSGTVGEIMQPPVFCSGRSSIRQAAELLDGGQSSALVILDAASTPRGLVSDSDLRSRVIVAGLSTDNPVETIQSTPLIQVEAETPRTEALLRMMRHGIKHLAVADGSGVVGLICERDLFLSQPNSPIFLLRDLHAAADVAGVKSAYAALPELIGRLVQSGAKARHLNSFITAATDAALERLLTLALEDMDQPPVSFAFLLFGSEGRREQTLKTDQDNAIVYEDVPKDEEVEVREYFLTLGRRVCDWLHEIGQTHCEFEIMAKTPTWCQPLSRWKDYYRRWIESDDPERLLRANIFFDFRLGFGNNELVQALHTSLFERLAEWPGFLRHLARNTLHFKPPLDFFGNFSLQERGERKDGLDLKSAMRLVVDFARIYAMQASITETNTIARLEAVYGQNALDKEELEDLVHAYEYLMFQRLKHQTETIARTGGPPDNYLQPKRLTHIEQQALKEAFKRIRTAQGKMRLDFFLHFP